MDAFTPQQTIELVSRIGTKKSHMRLDKLFWNSFMARPLLGFGCAVLLSTETAPWYQSNAPGLIRTAGALMFPIGLVMIVLTGADLFTSNIMFMTAAFLGNLGGMLFFMAIIIGYGGVLSDIPAYKEQTVTFAIQKAQLPGWHQIFLRGIGANWLVCMAVFLSISAREIGSKIMAIWFPTATFVALALDHVIANMFFITIGIWNGAPFGVGYYIWKSLIPTTLGNMVGGGLFVGAIYWYLYLTGEGSMEVSFDIGSLQSAMEAGGPMGRMRRFDVGNGHVIEGMASQGQDGDVKIASPSRGGTVEGDHLPHSGGPLQSGIANELSAEKYTKKKGTDESESDKTAV